MVDSSLSQLLKSEEYVNVRNTILSAEDAMDAIQLFQTDL